MFNVVVLLVIGRSCHIRYLLNNDYSFIQHYTANTKIVYKLLLITYNL